MFCPKCGKPAQESDAFCESCGTPLRAAEARATLQAAYTGEPGSPAYAPGWVRASFGHRLAGYIIDYVITTTCSVVLLFVLFTMELPGVSGTLLTFAAFFVYKWLMDASGGTLGKAIVGIRVVDERTLQPPGLAAGFVRTLVSLASGIPLGLGYLWAAWEPNGKTWHDLAASTIVILKPPATP